MVNPRYCEGLDFFQQNHLSVPTSLDFNPIQDEREFFKVHGLEEPSSHEFEQKNTELDFRGHYHGNGHWMIIPDGASINIANGVGGTMYNTGFVSFVNNDNTKVYDRNDGTITNCFYFNWFEKGGLTETGTLRNCYQNTKVKGGPSAGKKFDYNQLLGFSTMGFRYGQVAYNLNGFYLHKRHKLLHEEGARAKNNSLALEEMDKELRKLSPVTTASGVDDPYDKYAVDYIEKMFHNGDYRYAFYDNMLSQYGSQFTEALRTAEIPNYFDGLSQRNNKQQVSMHDYEHTKDAKRWCENHKCYHPIFDTDYLFFGENLGIDADGKDNYHLPELYTPETRVYRVGGFYGTDVDKGFFLNKEAYVDSPQLTALDFVGYRDKALYKTDASGQIIVGELKDDVKTALEDNSMTGTGWWIMNEDKDPTRKDKEQYQEIFMPPTIDVPWVENAEDGIHAEFESFRINSDKVTHNLLIYTHDNTHARSVMDDYHYADKTTDLGRTLHSYAEHDESLVLAHHILETSSGNPKAYGDMLHLVDAHDFNAPIAFDVNEAWYTRQPHDYADEYTVTSGSGKTYAYKTAWEGICLPYDVRKTYASSTDPINMTDMGEITHFFDDQKKGHEYWLRRYTGVNSENGDLTFERPTADNKGSAIDKVVDYVYRNSTFYNLYAEFEYNPDHDDLYHNDDDLDNDGILDDPLKLNRTITDYRHLSHNVPYIVTFPGERYYEFDLSGEFYKGKNDKVTIAVPQSITYFANGDIENKGLITIPRTDDTRMVEYSKNGYTLHGTFQHVTNDEDLASSVLYNNVTIDKDTQKTVSKLVVLDAYEADNSGKLKAKESHLGEEFQVKSDPKDKAKDKVVVVPFRVYMTTPSSSSSSRAPLRIGSDSVVTPQDIEEEDIPELPDTVDAEEEGIKVWVEDQKLVISTPYDLATTIFDMSGRPVRHIKAYEGINRYSGLTPGFYIVLHTKFLIY